jgi:hypothetical protein
MALGMRNRKVMGIFDRPGDAEKLAEELLEAGIARHRIVISRSEESIVGKVPEPGKRAHAPARTCLVAVVARSPVDREQIARLMLRHGARETLESRG